jgi:acyl-CoA reductase-like NAD-dependent aldehyde dehydrogenase
VLTLKPFDTFQDAVKQVNSSSYGIHTGVFTQDLSVVDQAYRNLEVGGVIINDYPTLRFDNMPYGGVKRSGFGREGVRYTMEEMTEPRTLLIRGL